MDAADAGLMWEMDFDGALCGRAQVTIQLLRSAGMRVHAQSRGVMNLDAHPTYGPATYAAIGWGTGRAWVLPLISLFSADGGPTIMPPSDNIPNLTFAWKDGKTLNWACPSRWAGKA